MNAIYPAAEIYSDEPGIPPPTPNTGPKEEDLWEELHTGSLE